ncbi:MAG: hypothetical protein GY926_07055 [bacterium]|nr:hypothetical protein [bacterium]
MSSVAASHDLTMEQFLPITFGLLERDGDHPWHAVERGEISLDEYDAAIVPPWKAAGFDSFPSPPRDVVEEPEVVPEMASEARAVREAGYGTAIPRPPLPTHPQDTADINGLPLSPA